MLLLISFSVRAQTACPTGVAAGSAQCGPSPVERHASPSMIDGRPVTTRFVPTGEWLNTWGAVAVDSDVGSIGASSGKLSKEEAGESALRLCASKGAKACSLRISYSNQCVATFFPGVAGGKGFSISGPTIEEASRLGHQRCLAENGTACNRVFTECTRPLFNRF